MSVSPKILDNCQRINRLHDSNEVNHEDRNRIGSNGIKRNCTKIKLAHALPYMNNQKEEQDILPTGAAIKSTLIHEFKIVALNCDAKVKLLLLASDFLSSHSSLS